MPITGRQWMAALFVAVMLHSLILGGIWWLGSREPVRVHHSSKGILVSLDNIKAGPPSASSQSVPIPDAQQNHTVRNPPTAPASQSANQSGPHPEPAKPHPAQSAESAPQNAKSPAPSAVPTAQSAESAVPSAVPEAPNTAPVIGTSIGPAPQNAESLSPSAAGATQNAEPVAPSVGPAPQGAETVGPSDNATPQTTQSVSPTPGPAPQSAHSIGPTSGQSFSNLEPTAASVGPAPQNAKPVQPSHIASTAGPPPRDAADSMPVADSGSATIANALVVRPSHTLGDIQPQTQTTARNAKHIPATAARTGDPTGHYVGALRAWLARHKQYPQAARKQHLEGTVKLYIVLDRNGRVIKAQVEQSSGSAILDRAARDMLAQSEPLPPMPGSVQHAQLELIIPIVFTLR